MSDRITINGVTLALTPRVRILASQGVHTANAAEFVAEVSPDAALNTGAHLDTEHAERIVEIAARGCYRSWEQPRPGGAAAFHEHIKEVGHGSVLENAVWTFGISGVARSLSHEWVRHRAGAAISQESQRYVDCGDVAFVVPWALQPAVRAYLASREDGNPDACKGRVWVSVCEEALLNYPELTEYLADTAPTDLTGTERRKWARQAARSVLPECAETRFVWTANARAIRHIIEQRASRHADADIRRLAVALWDVVAREAPLLFGDYKQVALPDGTYELVTKYRKV